MFAELDEEMDEDNLPVEKTKDSIKFRDFENAVQMENSHITTPDKDSSEDKEIADRMERPVKGKRMGDIRKQVFSEDSRRARYTT